MAKKKMTIEDLAVMTQKGFGEVDQKFTGLRNEMNERFDRVDEKFDKIEVRLDRIENLLI